MTRTPAVQGDDSRVVQPQGKVAIRIATFNTSLNRNSAGQLIADLSGSENRQARAIAQIIQNVAPDILVLQEFDYDKEGAALRLFQENYLSVAQGEKPGLRYPYVLGIESNTGVPSGVDLSGDGRIDGPGDAFGFGRHPGQYAFAILSRFPLDKDSMRSFQKFRWKDMPGALLPNSAPDSTDGAWYSEEVLGVMRLSSKNHVDLPVVINEQSLHLLIAHPTPPVFDGPEDRNGRRNHDEIRLFADYISPDKGHYLLDDQGKRGGLSSSALFCILGDMNADPVDGDSYGSAINQLLNNPRIHRKVASGEFSPRSSGGAEQARTSGKRGDAALHTAGWGLRVDYVLPSAQIDVRASGIYWPNAEAPDSTLVGMTEKTPTSSDHRLVWVDIVL